ncbi:MAG TPA: hypothetical protein VH114_03105 [Candidatus Acidoferrum sp.]|nr:hypothetical protein [Candidatus Acidoferrum sp.]
MGNTAKETESMEQASYQYVGALEPARAEPGGPSLGSGLNN